MTAPSAWTETCHVAIVDSDDSIIKLEALTETVDIDEGEKDMEGTPILNGGRVTKFTPEGDTTVTLEAYPVEAGQSPLTSGSAGTGFFGFRDTNDAIEPQEIDVDRTRTKYMLSMLWTDDTDVTSAVDSTASTKTAFRWSGKEGYVTAIKLSFTDGVLKASVTFKVSPFNKAAEPNIRRESTDGTALSPLPVLTYSFGV